MIEEKSQGMHFVSVKHWTNRLYRKIVATVYNVYAKVFQLCFETLKHIDFIGKLLKQTETGLKCLFPHFQLF